jgi:hypothetical protein
MRKRTSGRHLILVELNEVNFDVAGRYVEQLGLKNFGRVLSKGLRRTSSEKSYEQLEPWIQWVSAHSGLDAGEHGIFRLGDIVKSGVPQFFEKVEAAGYRVGAISPMNAENRLRAPAYFIPDPWTHTPTDGSFWSRHLWLALSQTVNDNSSGRITAGSALRLALALARFARPRHYGLYLKLLRRSKGAPWRKALLLDLFLHDLHMRLYQNHRPNFSTLFLNAGAHIQHHYFFNARQAEQATQRNPGWYIGSEDDPIAEMLQVYDTVLGEYLDMPDTSFLVATGLTQTPYDRIKYYYRLSNHEAFLSQLGLKFVRVLPRMTRDFVVEFDSEADCVTGQQLLASLRMVDDDTPLFGELDNRGTSLFAALTYPKEITASMQIIGGHVGRFEALPHVVFVAIKNGMHASHGYVGAQGDIVRWIPEEGSHVKGLHAAVMNFFGQPA